MDDDSEKDGIKTLEVEGSSNGVMKSAVKSLSMILLLLGGGWM